MKAFFLCNEIRGCCFSGWWWSLYHHFICMGQAVAGSNNTKSCHVLCACVSTSAWKTLLKLACSIVVSCRFITLTFYCLSFPTFNFCAFSLHIFFLFHFSALLYCFGQKAAFFIFLLKV